VSLNCDAWLPMKISYDKVTDALYLHLADRASVDSDEVASGIVVDSDTDGLAVGIDIQQASHTLGLHNLAVQCTYHGEDDVLHIRLSDKPAVRMVSPDWHANLSYADDGSLVTIELLDAKQVGIPLFFS
jgi:uncharacterized protein YuzE